MSVNFHKLVKSAELFNEDMPREPTLPEGFIIKAIQDKLKQKIPYQVANLRRAAYLLLSFFASDVVDEESAELFVRAGSDGRKIKDVFKQLTEEGKISENEKQALFAKVEDEAEFIRGLSFLQAIQQTRGKPQKNDEIKKRFLEPKDEPVVDGKPKPKKTKSDNFNAKVVDLGTKVPPAKEVDTIIEFVNINQRQKDDIINWFNKYNLNPTVIDETDDGMDVHFDQDSQMTQQVIKNGEYSVTGSLHKIFSSKLSSYRRDMQIAILGPGTYDAKTALQGLRSGEYEEEEEQKASTDSMSQYTKGLAKYHNPKQKLQSFKDKYKPKTWKQLAELRSYGL